MANALKDNVDALNVCDADMADMDPSVNETEL